MSRIIVHVKTRLVIDTKKDVSVDDVISDMDYDYTSNTEHAVISDTEVLDYSVIGQS